MNTNLIEIFEEICERILEIFVKNNITEYQYSADNYVLSSNCKIVLSYEFMFDFSTIQHLFMVKYADGTSTFLMDKSFTFIYFLLSDLERFDSLNDICNNHNYDKIIKVNNKDIIITDPCYLIKEDNNKNCPILAHPSYPKELDLKEGDYTPELVLKLYRLHKKYNKICDIIDNYNYNEIRVDDWRKCNYGDNMEVLGFTNYLVNSTIYGDWSCTTFNSDTNEELGKFCADAGLVGVFLLEEVLKYNPNFDYHISKPWTTTLIKNFTGTIQITNPEEGIVSVVGEGNVNFYTKQTGL